MAIAFEDSRRALEQQLSTKLDIVHLVLLIFLATLVIWAVTGKIDLYRTSDSGTLKTKGGAVTLQSQVAATIEQSTLTLGMQVKKGQVLLQLDDTEAQLTLSKLVNELNSNRLQQKHLGEERRLTEQKYTFLETSLQNEIKLTQAQLDQSRKVLATQQDIQKGLKILAKTSAVARMDQLRQDLEVVRADASTKVLVITLDSKNQQIPRNKREQAFASNQIDSQLTTLANQQDQLKKAISHAQLEVDEYTIVANSAGEVVQLSPLPIGNNVVKGQKLATITGGSDWLIHTLFRASDAVGHIKQGQYARVLVDGFPWRQYGSLEATVTHVAKEGLKNHVEVQLTLKENSGTQIPLTFGQPVTVEIRTQAITPVMLLLNAADRAVRGKS
jgi:multidrug resistance efflux pump